MSGIFGWDVWVKVGITVLEFIEVKGRRFRVYSSLVYNVGILCVCVVGIKI